MLKHRDLIGFILALCSLAACASSPKAKTVPQKAKEVAVQVHNNQRIDVVVGAMGGTLSLGSNAELRIPEGAIPIKTEIHFRFDSDSSLATQSSTRRHIGPTVHIGPELGFAKAIELRVRAPQSSNQLGEGDLSLFIEKQSPDQRGLGLGGTRTRWEYWPAKRDGEYLSAQLNEVYDFRMQFVVEAEE
ncbi:MAG: hypothetical protein IPJ88_17245 [Myxococcales bacterium]|nr:MAG: hypothetical protein IPJ88_17245 [Myxococcales bacterium]